MSSRYCPDCGHQHPAEARFCMYCGYMLNGEPGAIEGNPGPATARATASAVDMSAGTDQAAPARTDWGTIIAALLAAIGLHRMSRKARQTAIVVVILMMFFGCPLVCGFIAFVMEWFAQLFH